MLACEAEAHTVQLYGFALGGQRGQLDPAMLV